MKTGAGSKMWFVPDAYYPEKSSGHFPSHEAICLLNTGEKDAEVEIILYFEDRDKIEGFKAVCPAGRTRHVRMDRLKDAAGNGVPQGVPYAMTVASGENIVVQYSRMDTSQAEMALMTTMAYPL